MSRGRLYGHSEDCTETGIVTTDHIKLINGTNYDRGSDFPFEVQLTLKSDKTYTI